TVVTYPIGIGREGWTTPEGRTKITFSAHKPTWYPPKSIREEYAAEGNELAFSVPAGPDNPLGEYAIYLNFPGYLMHGTNKPLGVGMRVSHGCIRLYPEDIENLVKIVKRGTAVNIIKKPYKAGWRQGRLYLEAHKPLAEEFEQSGLDLTRMVATVIDAHKNHEAAINWDLAEQSARKHSGLPVPITAPVVEDIVTN
ncbi:MAG: L,D-transpeptidase family protein, partial [Pseudomonadales bacterium]